MIVVAGPRIDPASLPAHDGLEVRAYVPDLYRHLARLRPRRRPGRPDDRDGADRQPAAVPLLPAAPPLRAELPRAPPPRALRRRAGAWTSTTATPESIAAAIAEEIGREVDYRPVETDGAARGRGAARRAALIRGARPRIEAMAVRSPSQLANRARIEACCGSSPRRSISCSRPGIAPRGSRAGARSTLSRRAGACAPRSARLSGAVQTGPARRPGYDSAPRGPGGIRRPARLGGAAAQPCRGERPSSRPVQFVGTVLRG